jgi:DeoR family fructose operon transcriptional repressor
MNKMTSRETYLLNMLSSAGRITTGEVVKLFNISEATARRMFTKLERSGKIVRNYGGIQLMGRLPDYSFELREKVYQQEKVNIGKLAASFVEDGDTIYLDCGTTIFQMTLALSERIANNEFTSLNIITNSIANVQAIAPRPACGVILVGGKYNSERRDFSGSLTEKYAAPFHFNKCFLGCDGMDSMMGFSSNQFEISSLNSLVMERADMAYVLLDSSKFGRCSLASYAKVTEISAVITDRYPEEPLQKALTGAGVRIYVTEACEISEAEEPPRE